MYIQVYIARYHLSPTARSSALPRPRHADVNYTGNAQHQDQGRHEDQSVRKHGPLDGHARGVGPSDDVLLLQRQMNIRRDN